MRITEVYDDDTDLTDDQVMEFVHLVDQNCKPYIKELGGWKNWLHRNNGESYRYNLFRGIQGADAAGEKPVREGRKPKDVPMYVHREIDEWFNQRHGHPFRSNAMFAISSSAIAGEYGDTYVVFPQGNFTFCYSAIYQDLWSHVEEAIHYVEANIPFDTPEDETIETILNEVIELLDNGRYKTDDMQRAIELQTEVMVACPKYYYLDWGVYINQMLEIVHDAVEDGILT